MSAFYNHVQDLVHKQYEIILQQSLPAYGSDRSYVTALAKKCWFHPYLQTNVFNGININIWFKFLNHRPIYLWPKIIYIAKFNNIIKSWTGNWKVKILVWLDEIGSVNSDVKMTHFDLNSNGWVKLMLVRVGYEGPFVA